MDSTEKKNLPESKDLSIFRSLLKHHDVKNKYSWAVTLCYKRKYEIFEPSQQLDFTITDIIDKLKPRCEHFLIMPELTKLGRIHYHIALTLKPKRVYWFLKVFRPMVNREFGMVKEIDDQTGWLRYMLKTWKKVNDYNPDFLFSGNFPINETDVCDKCFDEIKKDESKQNIDDSLDYGVFFGKTLITI